jgi:arylsulfatase A-like enzyme/Flp pilus assembly protein TadD
MCTVGLRRFWVLISVLISLLFIAASCRRMTVQLPLRNDQFHGASVLLVTIDTLRADRVGAYGNRNGLTPTLDQLAANGVRYTRAISHAPLTLPAHTSILTGLTPRKSGVRNNTSFRLDDRIPTVATFLKRAGYRTGAFVGAFVLDSRFGLARDFDVYDDQLPHSDRASFQFAERRAADVVKAAGDWIIEAANPRQAESHPTSSPLRKPLPWFAWVHLFDPHAPYDAPPEFRPGRSPYDAEVAYADAMLGNLLDRLRLAHQLDHTLIIVTADHGESLGEHGETTHGLFAYEATIHVPLIISTPGSPSEVVDAPVAHMDIAPTILDLVGAATVNDREGSGRQSSSGQSFEGQSLVQTPTSGRPLYFEALDAWLTRDWAPLKGVIQGSWKYIDLPEPELYDLSSDPAERRNLIARSNREDSLRRLLAQLDTSGAPSPPGLSTVGASAPAPPLDAEAAARLRALGYVGGAAPPKARTTPRTFTLSDDPKRLVVLNEQFNSALTAFDDGRSAEALSRLTAVLHARPDFTSARTSAATVLLSQGRSRDAVQLLRDAAPEEQSSPELLEKLGAALRDAGDLRAAAATFEEARRVGDRNLSLLQDLAVTYARLGRSAEARALFSDLTKQDPSAATIWYNLGLFELQSHRPNEAAEAFRRAVSLEPSYGDAWHALGAALVTIDADGAIDAWRQAEALLPHDYDLLFNLGMLSAQSDRPADGVPYLQRFVREAPRDRYAQDIRLVQRTLKRLASGTR